MRDLGRRQDLRTKSTNNDVARDLASGGEGLGEGLGEDLARNLAADLAKLGARRSSVYCERAYVLSPELPHICC